MSHDLSHYLNEEFAGMYLDQYTLRTPKPTMPVPVGLARVGVNTLGRAGLLPISPAQFEMLVEGNTCDPSAFFDDFGVSSPAFDADALSYLQQY